MSRYNVLRLGKFATFLILILLWASAAPIDARIERDNGIVRVKSRRSDVRGDHPYQGGYRSQGH